MNLQQLKKAASIYRGWLKESGCHDVAIGFVRDYTSDNGLRLSQDDVDWITVDASDRPSWAPHS